MDLKEKQIIYVDNKPHIKCGVVMLETKDTTPLFLNTHQTKVGDMVLKHGKFHHLYFTSDEEIKEGDWCYNSISNGLEKWSYKGWIEAPDFEYLGYKKIIATTDTSLGLPQPSKAFIEKYIEEYNNGNFITEVLVEVECDGVDFAYRQYYKLKLDSQNQITIRKQKDSWSREEVEKLLLKHQSDYRRFVRNTSPLNWSFDISKWIKENLI